MAYSINFNEEKNQLLKATRGVCFDDVLLALNNKQLLANKKHPSPKFKHQWIYVLRIGSYVYVAPYVVNEQKKEIYLKTIYPSRVQYKKFIRKGDNEKTKK